MPHRHRGPRQVPLSVAVVLVGASAFLAFAIAPSALAQVENPLDPQRAPPADSAPETPPVDAGGLDGLVNFESFPLGVALGITLTLGVIAATLAFLGGTKFVNSENVLENDARRHIFEYIQRHPGVHLRATAAALDLSTTNVLWHLRKLEGAKLVSSKKFEGYKVFYPVEGGVESRNRAIGSSVLRNDNAREILEYILGQPSAHQREIARAMGVNHGTIRWHLRKLTEASLILQVKNGSQTSYYVSDLGLQLLADSGNARAQAHRAGGERAPGAATLAPTAPMMGVAHVAMATPPAAAVVNAAPPATTPSPRYAPDMDED